IRLFIVLIIYSIVNAILIMIIRKIDRFFKLPILNTLNTFAGLVFGLLKGVLIVFIIYTLLTPVIILNKESFIATNTMESALGMYFYNPDFLLNFLKNNYINFMNFMTL
ncbi:MAG: CvpA family protein, partial [Tissierella sp.]|uniref:CvpA family protein n=1 Tax=Tissierella sp. TaxID=41274 RepID=UPI003F9B5DD3